MKSFSRCSVSGPSVSSPTMMPEVIFEAVAVQRPDRLQHRDRVVVPLLHRVERVGFGRLDADEHAEKPASFISARMSVCLAMFSVASQANITG